MDHSIMGGQAAAHTQTYTRHTHTYTCKHTRTHIHTGEAVKGKLGRFCNFVQSDVRPAQYEKQLEKTCVYVCIEVCVFT